MLAKTLLRTGIAALLSLAAMAEEKPAEILIHEGPVFTSPGLGPEEEITYIKEFPVPAAKLEKHPQPLDGKSRRQLSAAKAIELAEASVETGDGPVEKKVVRLELLHHGPNKERGIPYYLIELNVQGSEIHRVILMDGTVVKSRLRRMKE
jgi:hypothetical protein